MQIERYTANFCDVDRLDGVAVADGEQMLVRWPDGTESAETVHVEASSSEYQDHGHTYRMPVRRAYVEHVLRGATVRVWLREAGVKLERS